VSGRHSESSGWKRPLGEAAVGLVYFAFCLLLDTSAGAWRTPFVAYPDEPAHFVGSVMLHDWLLSGRPLQPVAFAWRYYEHYPFFAVGYWPPLFYVAAGIWFLLAGVGRWQALIVPAACAAGSAWLLFALVRRRAGPVAGFCAGLLYLSLPDVQQTTTMVMVDHFTAFLSLLVLLLSVQLLREPSLAGGIRCALACAAAVLSKYSALYVCALPFALALFSRRLDLWRKPAFWLQPAIVAAIVGPWAWWTAPLAAYGLPPGPHPLSPERPLLFLGGLLHMFPEPLLAPLAIGLVALLLFPSRWGGEELGTGLVAAGSVAFLLISPVGAEPRHLLVAAAALLVLSVFGWTALLSGTSDVARRAAVACLVAGTLAFSLVEWGRFPRPAQYPVEAIVKAVIGDPRWQGCRIMVPSNVEGPFIAEFAWLGSRNPAYQLVRPNKVFASQGWFGNAYSSRVRSPEEMMAYLRRNPVCLILWDGRPPTELRPHERVMDEMLRRYPAVWRPVFALPGGPSEPSAWTVFEYAPQRR
jgi:4-amino-4-deoxy-L-arabinose transferase-like glycosyltransferase